MAPTSTTRYDRDSIIAVALRLLDEVGLPDLSMRRLGTELGVQPSALYWHFANKQELLAAVAGRILEPLSTPASAEDISAAAAEVRDTLLTYRDGAEVVMSTYALGFDVSPIHNRLAAAIPPHTPDAQVAVTALSQFILGHAYLIQQRMHAESYGAQASEAATPDDWARSFERGVAAFAMGLRTPA